jgi:HEAT repeat protein
VTNGLVINIDAHEIRTGWELEAVAPEGIEEKIAGLIRDLNADDVEVREKAHEALVAIGEPARDQLKQAAKDDKAPERASRAKAILSRLGSPRPPIVESFDFNAIR